MTLQLPHKNVGVNATGKVHPLAPHEKKALENIDDPEVAKQILAETIHASRRAQENIERIAMEFPIQPANLSNEVVTIEEPGEPGQAIVLGEDGKPAWGEPQGGGSGGGAGERGLWESFEYSLAPGAGTVKHFLVPFSIPFTYWFGLGWSSVPSGKTGTAAPWSGAKFAASAGSNPVSRSEEGMVVQLWSSSYGEATNDRFVAPSPGPLVLRLERAAGANENFTSHFVLVLANGSGPCQTSGSGTGLVSGTKKPERKPQTNITVDLNPCAIVRRGAELPVARSDQSVFEGLAEASTGESRFVGFQFRFRTAEEREEELDTPFWWEFGSSAEGRTLETSLRDPAAGF